jgi:sugar lactone lactonase YvrE
MGVWMDKDQNIYSSVYSARMVKKITPEGKISTFIESEKTWSPTGGLFDSDGNLWLLEYSLRNKARVRKIGNNGKETLFE